MVGFRQLAQGWFRAPSAIWGLLLSLAVTWLAIRPAMAETVTVEGREFEIPDGFVLQRIAGPNLVPRPIVGDFNEQGDFFVADSSGSNDDVETQLKERPHRVLRLRDINGDGVFDERTVFADQMMFPEGVMCHQGSVFVSAPPQIWKLTDHDNDGVVDQREVWFDGQTLTGCANDLHGPYLGPDGWVYWCKGAFAEQTYTTADGGTWSTRAAHVFRRRVDGGHIEAVMTGGMDNPVDVAFTAAGERIFTTTFLQHPAGGQRDGLIHAIYGGVYGKSHGVLDGHPRTGELMPVLSHLGPAAPCGLARLDGDLLSAEFDDNLLSCAFNLHQVTRHRLTADEATFRSDDSVLLASPDLDFHPTDVLQDADGSIVVIDTGGWYKLCCPTSQLAKPDVLGGIYRLSLRDAPRVVDPRGRTLDWQDVSDHELVARLDDTRHAVRQRATATLAHRGALALATLQTALTESQAVRVRRQAVWAACQIDDPAAVVVLTQALSDADASVRQASLHALSVRRERSAAAAVTQCLSDNDPSVRRAAAEAIGRLDDPQAIPVLLEQTQHAQGRVLQHSLVFALIEIADQAALDKAWAAATPAARRAILLAIDQMPHGRLESGKVLESLTAADEPLRQTAAWIVARHDEWAVPAADQILTELPGLVDQPARADELVDLLARFIADADVQARVAAVLLQSDTAAVRERLLQSIQQYPGKSLGSTLQRALARQLESPDASTVPAVTLALAAHAREMDDLGLVERIRAIADRGDGSRKLRLQAMTALRGRAAEMPDSWFDLTLNTALEDEEFELRRLATEALSGARLNRAQLARMINSLPQADPVELGQLISLIKQTNDEELARLALERLSESEAAVVLTDSFLRESFAHFDAATRQAVESLLESRLAGQAEQTERLQELLGRLPSGDIRRGQQVFHSSKAACFACHAMGYRGGDVGPDLTRIGRIRSRRDLLEAIAFPSLSFVRSYEPVSITTKSGLTIQGVVKDENQERLLLVNDQRKVVEIARSEVELAEPGRVSVMPSGLDQLLSDAELADLLAFLEASQ